MAAKKFFGEREREREREMTKVKDDETNKSTDFSKAAGFKTKKRKKNTKSALNRRMRREKKFKDGATGLADRSGIKKSRRAAEKKALKAQKKMERYVFLFVLCNFHFFSHIHIYLSQTSRDTRSQRKVGEIEEKEKDVGGGEKEGFEWFDFSAE